MFPSATVTHSVRLPIHSAVKPAPSIHGSSESEAGVGKISSRGRQAKPRQGRRRQSDPKRQKEGATEEKGLQKPLHPGALLDGIHKRRERQPDPG